jgi:hypothetical protein
MNEYTTIKQLQATIWDLYKDVHGMRPRYWTAQEWDSREFLEQQYDRLMKIVNNFTAEQLANENWQTV